MPKPNATSTAIGSRAPQRDGFARWYFDLDAGWDDKMSDSDKPLTLPVPRRGEMRNHTEWALLKFLNALLIWKERFQIGARPQRVSRCAGLNK